MDNTNLEHDIKALMIELLSSGLSDQNYSVIIDILENIKNSDVDCLIFLLEYLNIHTPSIDLIVKEYQLHRIRQNLNILSENYNDIKNKDSSDEIFSTLID